MLTASYVLLTLGGGREQVRSGMTYVVISLLASTLFITALALLYAATGTVNMADLAGQARRPARRPAARRSPSCSSSCSASRPGCSRCSPGCPTATRSRPSAVTAVFAGLLTKVGVYALIRTQTLLFPEAEPTGHAAARARRADDGGRHPRRHRPGRRQADPVVQHRQPHRLHGDGAGAVHRRRARRGDLLHGAPHRGDDDAVPHRRADRARRRLVAAQPPRQHGRARRR